MTTALQILSKEHQHILKVITTLTKECDNLQTKQELNEQFFRQAIEFIRNYADKFHHAKEEDLLFKEFCKDESKMHCNPTPQMLHEHELGRDFVQALEQSLNNKDIPSIIKNSQGYANLLQEHIFKEDNILYPMIDEALNDHTKNNLLKQFKQIEKQFAKETNKYLKFVEEISKR